MKRVLADLTLLRLLIGAFVCVCFVWGQATYEPRAVAYPITETIVETEYVEVIDEVRVPVEVPVRIWVEVEKEKELRHFESSRELERWLDKYPIWINPPEDYDCEDYAQDLAEKAFNDGYWMSVQYDVAKRHALNSAWVGQNGIYFIEPQTHEFWFWECRD